MTLRPIRSPPPQGALSALKDLFRAHRGFLTEHARRAAEWKLNSLTAQPHNPWSLVREEHYNPAPTRPKETPLDDEQIGPAAYDTGFNWEDGNGIQHGWGGRSR